MPRSFTRRHVVTTLAPVAGVTALATTGCDSSGGASAKRRGPARVEWWVYGGGVPIGDTIFRSLSDEYQRKFPDTTIQYTAVPSADLPVKLLVAWTADTVPDIVMDSWRTFVRYIDSSLYLDLSKDFAGRKYKPTDFYEKALSGYQIDGKQMGMPQGWGNSLYAMNLNVFESAGVKLAPGFDDTWTLDDCVRMLKQVVKFEPDGKQAAPCGVVDNIFFHWLWTFGGDFISADATKALTTSPEALAAAEWYQRVHTGDRVYMRDGIDRRAGIGFDLGNQAVEGNGIPNSLTTWDKAPYKVNVFNRPRVPGNKPAIHRSYMDGYILSKATKVRDATVDLLFWLLDDGAVMLEKQGGVNIPSYKKVAETVFLGSPSPYNKKKWIDAAKTMRSEPIHAKWMPDMSMVYSKYTMQLRTGQAGPREAMQNMATDLQAILDDYRRSRAR